jgi:hypothetical protein
MSLQSLPTQAGQHHLIAAELKPKVESWMRARNAIVHSSMMVTKVQTQEILDGVLHLVNQWN